ncbi:MAG: ComF family protein [Clostridiaceae bacterium]|mgnify:CR=1 FL=1|nr:ComF family protein [Clostridiaceae bacterium]
MECGKIPRIEYFLRMFFPPRCICCDCVLAVNVRNYLCSDCEKNIPYINRHQFGNPAGKSISNIYCAFDYEKGIRKAIHHLKFNDRPGNAKILVDMSYPLIKEYFAGVSAQFERANKYDIAIPVPIHSKRRRERGYNQSELIARSLAKKLNIPVSVGTLVKRKNTPPQSSLAKDERYKNPEGAFHVKKPYLIEGRRVLLVDDVITTGSTLEECGKVLLQAGAVCVDAFVIAVRRKLYVQ